MKECKIEWRNVWTSAGKKLAGEVVPLPDDEAKELRDKGAVSLKRGRKAEAD